MATQYISANAIIGKFIRDFKPQNTAFEVDAIEWVAEALDIMKLAPCYINKTAKLTITCNRVKIPCDVLEIAGILIDNIDGTDTNGVHYELYNGVQGIESINSSISSSSFPWYQKKGNFLHFKFEKGGGYIYYYGMPVDECGYPLVPDDTKVTNSITWYILMKWLARGNKHPVFDYFTAEKYWFRDYPRAQNSIKHITPEKMAKVARNWIQLLPRIDRHEDFFTEQQYYFNSANTDFDISAFTSPAIEK
tara:strand:+ start:488 stop:1234 length:747 start_codon:yes stop_codon:yes gene_type:complete